MFHCSALLRVTLYKKCTDALCDNARLLCGWRLGFVSRQNVFLRCYRREARVGFPRLFLTAFTPSHVLRRAWRDREEGVLPLSRPTAPGARVAAATAATAATTTGWGGWGVLSW